MHGRGNGFWIVCFVGGKLPVSPKRNQRCSGARLKNGVRAFRALFIKLSTVNGRSATEFVYMLMKLNCRKFVEKEAV